VAAAASGLLFAAGKEEEVEEEGCPSASGGGDDGGGGDGGGGGAGDGVREGGASGGPVKTGSPSRASGSAGEGGRSPSPQIGSLLACGRGIVKLDGARRPRRSWAAKSLMVWMLVSRGCSRRSGSLPLTKVLSPVSSKSNRSSGKERS
jgi:hypothetical protein